MTEKCGLERMSVAMKRLLTLILCLTLVCACGTTLGEMSGGVQAFESGSDMLVMCFSATDNTWDVAVKIAALTGADIFRIEPEVPYTSDDLNWRSSDSRANKEQENDSCRPAIAGLPEGLDGYKTVFIGFPIWWGTVPQIIKTLIETCDWQDKTVVPFCTSGSSGISDAIQDLKAMDCGAQICEAGRRFPAGADEDEVRRWLKEIGYLKEEAGMNRMIITIGDSELTVRLAENESAEALKDWLASGPKTISASNYGGFEKVCPLGVRLPSHDEHTTTQPGDVMLYASNQIVIFHGNNSWAYTRLGWIEGKTNEELRAILSGPETEITLRLE